MDLSIQTEIILRQLRRAGYDLSIHRNTERIELHAVLAIDRKGPVYVAKGYGPLEAPLDDEFQMYMAAFSLSARLRVDTDGP